MTRQNVVQLGRSSRHLTAEAMKMEDWPLAVSTLEAEGFVEVQKQLLDPHIRELRQLRWSTSELEDDLTLTSDSVLTPTFTNLVSLHLEMSSTEYSDSELEEGDDPMPSVRVFLARCITGWKHSPQHLTIDKIHEGGWVILLSVGLPHLRTLHLRYIDEIAGFRDPSPELTALRDEVQEDWLPALKEIQFSWREPPVAPGPQGGFAFLPPPRASTRRVRAIVAAIREKFRTPAREAAGNDLRFLCEMEGYNGSIGSDEGQEGKEDEEEVEEEGENSGQEEPSAKKRSSESVSASIKAAQAKAKLSHHAHRPTASHHARDASRRERGAHLLHTQPSCSECLRASLHTTQTP
jgi:hypothetical protein